MPAPPSLPLALVVAAAVALLAWRLRALTTDGALAATAVGAAMLRGAGWGGGAVLLVFFAGSSAVGRLLPRRARSVVDEKGERRDRWQVLANGGAAAAGALLAAGSAAALWPATAALAAAGADTWATAWGAGSRASPRHLLTGQVVPPGTSGGITARGTFGAALGAVVIALTGAAAAGAPALGIVAATLGVAGMFLDSALGAVLQGRFRCPACDAPSEWARHRCGTPTVHTGGLAWLTNDGVNGLATAAAALGGWLAWRWAGA